MSDICIENILPTRTRSGMHKSHLSVKRETVVKQEPLPDLNSRITKYMLLSRNLYNEQIAYIKEATKNRDHKFELMSRYESLIEDMKDLLQGVKSSKSIEDVQTWVELLCWRSRINIFHQSVCVA